MDCPAHRAFRRQFLATDSLWQAPDGWSQSVLPGSELTIHAHPELPVTSVRGPGGSAALSLGYVLDPQRPSASDQDLLADLLASAGRAQLIERLAAFCGRFVIFLHYDDCTMVFHDPCGLRTVYYLTGGHGMCIGSQPTLMTLVQPLSARSERTAFLGSAYVRDTAEFWLPCGLTLYNHVGQLLPNHYLDLQTMDQVRYWPCQPLLSRSKEEAAGMVSRLLAASIAAAAERFPLAVTLTAGWDSRTILAAARDLARDIYCYTLVYRDLDSESWDVHIPQEILAGLGIAHHLLDCRGKPSQAFRDCYVANADLAHEDWGRIAWGLDRAFPPERVAVKGNVAEIARCFYYKLGCHRPIERAEDLLALEPGWKAFGFIGHHLTSWLKEAESAAEATGMDILDLFYWEHRMGGWQAQSQLEWDLVQEAFTPFNSRPVIGALLGVDRRHRRFPDYELFRLLIDMAWPELLNWPINPLGFKGRLKALVGDAIFSLDRVFYRRQRRQAE